MARGQGVSGTRLPGVEVLVAAVGVGLMILRALAGSLGPSRTGGRTRTLLTLDADYSLRTIQSRGLDRILTAANLDGFFTHVWTAHPLVGADPIDAVECSLRGLSTADVAEGHTVIESGIGYTSRLSSLPVLNFVVAQAVLLHHLDRLIRKQEIGVVRAGEPFYLGLVGLLLARANRIPLAVRLIANYDADFWAGRPVHQRLFRRRSIEKRVERFVLRRTDLVIAGNLDILQYALVNGAAKERSTVALVGSVIDPVHFSERPVRQDFVSAELHFDGRPFLVCVTRLEKVKHPEDVVHVLAKAREQVPDLAAVLVGDGVMRQELEAIAHDLGLGAALVFAGNRNQEWIADVLRSATVVLSPLTGRALVEAALSATPIVAYDVDWHSELVRSGETGLLVPYRDTHEMARAVCGLIAEPERAERLGAQARARALETMCPAMLVARERLDYEKLLQL